MNLYTHRERNAEHQERERKRERLSKMGALRVVAVAAHWEKKMNGSCVYENDNNNNTI